MEFALNHVGFPHDDIEQNFDLLRGAGYDGVELNLTEDGPLWDEQTTSEIADLATKYELDVHGLSTTLHWEYPLSSRDESVRARGIEVGERMIDAACEIGAATVLIVPGLVDETMPYDEVYETALESVQELASRAQDDGIRIGVENVWNGFLLSPLEFASFVDEAADAGPVGAYFDVGNVRRFGRPDQWIRILGDRIERIHVKDYDTAVDTMDGFTYPLQGDVDWNAVASALDEIGYDDWITAEVPPYESYGEQMPPQLLANLRQVFS